MAAAHDTSDAATLTRQAPARPLANVRTRSLATLTALVVQYALGVAENLYGTMPDAQHSIGLFSGGTLLAVHGIFGVILALGGIGAAVQAVRSRHRRLAISSGIAMLALIAATMMGFMFLDKGQDGASLGMGLAAGVAMICYGYNIWITADARESA